MRRPLRPRPRHARQGTASRDAVGWLVAALLAGGLLLVVVLRAFGASGASWWAWAALTLVFLWVPAGLLVFIALRQRGARPRSAFEELALLRAGGQVDPEEFARIREEVDRTRRGP